MTIQNTEAIKALFIEKNEWGRHTLKEADLLAHKLSMESGVSLCIPRVEELLAIRSILPNGSYWAYGGVELSLGVFVTKIPKFYDVPSTFTKSLLRLIRRPELDEFAVRVVKPMPDASTLFGYALTAA
jgi:hypothetical protein